VAGERLSHSRRVSTADRAGRSRLFAAALLAALGACGKGGDKADDRKEPPGLPKLEAAALYRDYGSMKGAARLEKFGRGVVVSGAVTKRINLGEAEGVQLRLAVDAPDPAHVAARFQDNGAAVVKKKIRPGEIVSLRCQIGGKPAEVLFLADCVLEE
jgi:hypothetical protein